MGFSDPMLLPLNYRCFRGIELYFLAPGQVLDLRSSAWLNAKMLDQIEIGGCNGIRTHIGDFTRPLTADSLPIRFHAPIEIGGRGWS